jgi:hypothetical protein
MENNNNAEIEIDYRNNVDFLARFACLYEAVNMTCDKAEQLGINPSKSSDWIKPLAFQKYIKERERDMKYQINNFVNGVNIDD